MIASKCVEFQFVAGRVAVQSGGVSSVTTTRGYGYLRQYSHRKRAQLREPSRQLNRAAQQGALPWCVANKLSAEA